MTSHDPKPRVLVTVLAVGVALLAGPRGRAANVYWSNPVGGFYDTASNWTPVGAPGASDLAVFNYPGDYHVGLLADQEVAGIEVFDNAGVTLSKGGIAGGSGVFGVGGAVNVIDSRLTLGDAGGLSAFHLDASGPLDVTGFVNDGSRGKVTVNSNATLSTAGGAIGRGMGRFGRVLVEGDGAIWDAQGETLFVGTPADLGAGGGWVNVLEGARLISDTTRIGATALNAAQTNTGSVVVSGVGSDGTPSSWTAGLVALGAAGGGNVRIDGGAQATFGFVELAVLDGGQARIDVHGTDPDGNPTSLTTGTMRFGSATDDNKSSLYVTGGASVVTERAEVGVGSRSDVHVTGNGLTAPSQWEVTNGLRIGFNRGSVYVDEGASLVTDETWIGYRQDASGSLEVSSNSPSRRSTWINSGNVYVGGTNTADWQGAGRLEVGDYSSAAIDGQLKVWSEGRAIVWGGHLHAALIDISEGGALSLIEGQLTFDAFRGDLVNPAVEVSPAAGVGTGIVFGDFQQESQGVLRIDLAGSASGEFDLLDVDGFASLGGDLTLSLDAGFDPVATDEYLVVDSDFVSGSFDNVASGERLETLDGRGSFLVSYGASSPYGSGSVVLSAFLSSSLLPGDYNADGAVDAADYSLWRDNVGMPAGTLANDADGGPIGQAQYETWRTNYGATASSLSTSTAAAVPEAAALGLAATGWLLACVMLRRASRSAR